MKKLLYLSGVLSISFIANKNVFAFWDQSHQLISEIASQKLSQNTFNEAKRLLNIKINYPGNETLSINTNDFDTAASWADNIKNYNSQKINKNLSLCHYTDIPLAQDMIDKPIDEEISMNKLKEAIASNPFNSVSCLKSFIKTLISPKETEVNKAISLRMVLHIVGDFGQPLHNSSFIEGKFDDAGGNKISLEENISFSNIDESSTKVNNMHKLWDGSLGVYLQFPYNKEDSALGIYTSEEKKATKNLANDILMSKDFAQMDFNFANDNNESAIEKWAIDSYKVAVASSYSDLLLNAPSKKGVSSYTASFVNGFNSYQMSRKSIVEMQIKKSGIRLYHILNSIFDSNSPKNQYSTLVAEIQNDSEIKPFIIK